MIRSYKDFKERLDNMLIIRSKNYVNSDCDIDLLAETVFQNIAHEVALKWRIFSFTIDNNQDVYDLPKTNEDDIPPTSSGTAGEFTEYYAETFDMVDGNGDSVANFFAEPTDGEYFVNNQEFQSQMDGQEVFVVRRAIPDIKNLDIMLYDKIFSAMLEGIIYHIQDSVPSQTDGQLANLSYQRFFNEKKKLLATMPQYRWMDGMQIGSTSFGQLSL